MNISRLCRPDGCGPLALRRISHTPRGHGPQGLSQRRHPPLSKGSTCRAVAPNDPVALKHVKIWIIWNILGSVIYLGLILASHITCGCRKSYNVFTIPSKTSLTIKSEYFIPSLSVSIFFPKARLMSILLASQM